MHVVTGEPGRASPGRAYERHCVYVTYHQTCCNLLLLLLLLTLSDILYVSELSVGIIAELSLCVICC